MNWKSFAFEVDSGGTASFCDSLLEPADLGLGAPDM